MLKGLDSKQQVHNWTKEIRVLLRDFRVPNVIINQIIRDTKSEAKSSDNAFTLYNKAWRKAHDIIMSI